MIIRNDKTDNVEIAAETDNDRARISIKKCLLTFGCMVSAVLCGFSFYGYKKGADARDAEAQEIIDMTNDIEIPVWKIPSGGSGTDIVADMSSAGMDVASLQNRYFGDEDMLDIQSELRDYFGDSSGELKWFSPGQDFNDMSWHYETGSGIESAGRQGLWLCRDGSGTLYAYTLAEYDVGFHKFKDAECHVTTAGFASSSAVDVSSEGRFIDDEYDEYYDFMSDPEGRLSDGGEVDADVSE